MPFASESQRRWMYANEPEMAAEWQKETPKEKKLPKHVEKKADLNEILTMLLTGGGLGAAGGATLAHKYHKRKMPQYEEKGSIRGYEEGFADAGRTLQDQLQASMAPYVQSITRRKEDLAKAASFARTKQGNELLNSLMEQAGGFLPKIPTPPEVSDSSGTPFGQAMDAMSGAGKSIFGTPNIPDQIELGNFRGSLPDSFYNSDHMQDFMQQQGINKEQFEQMFMPGARMTMPGEPIREAASAAQVAAPLSALGLGAGALTKSMLKGRRHLELLQAMKGVGGTKLSSASIALSLMTKSSGVIPIPAGSAYRRMEQPPGMRSEAATPAKPNAFGRLLDRVAANMPKAAPQASPARQAPTLRPQTPMIDLDAIHQSLRSGADELAAAHPSLGGQQHPESVSLPEFGPRGEDAMLAMMARKNMPTQEVPNAPFSQFIQEFKNKQRAPLW